MTSLEARYRRLLRAYPKSFRDSRGDELLSMLLDASEGHSRPSLAMTWSIVGQGVGCRLRAIPDGRQAAVAAGEVGLLLALVAAVATPLLGAWIGTGYVAGSVAGCVLWSALASLLIVSRMCGPQWRLPIGAAALMGGGLAYLGGAELMGALRPFIASFLIAAVVALVAPRPSRRRAAVGAIGSVSVAVALAGFLAWRVDHGYSRQGPFDMDRIWSGVPWLYVELGALVPAVALLAVGLLALIVGLFRPYVALAAALVAVPMAVIGLFLHRSVWFQTDSVDPSTAVLTVSAGAAATVVLALVGRRRRPATG